MGEAGERPSAAPVPPTLSRKFAIRRDWRVRRKGKRRNPEGLRHTLEECSMKQEHRCIVRGMAAIPVAAALALFGFGGVAQAQITTAITGTGHDLSAMGGAVPNQEICVYCHTPHGADTAASAPLWNRNIAAGPNYTRYSDLNTATLQGSEAPVGSVSLACLSCHDGTQAMDTIINAPGQGTGTFTSDPGFTIQGKDGGLVNNLALIGTDLRNDHPISIQYGGGGITADNPTAAPNDSGGYRTPQTAEINTNRVWWLPSVQNGEITLGQPRQRTDIFLYTRTDVSGAVGTPQPTVECGSCHDPHVATNTPTVEVNFMRTSNQGSAVCLSCHNM